MVFQGRWVLMSVKSGECPWPVFGTFPPYLSRALSR